MNTSCKRCRRHLKHADEMTHCRACLHDMQSAVKTQPEHECMVFLCIRPAQIRAWWIDDYMPGLCREHMVEAEASSNGLDLGGGWRVQVPGLVRGDGCTKSDVQLYWPERRASMHGGRQ